MINDISVKRDGKDKNEYKLTLRIGRSNRYFDDIKKQMMPLSCLKY